MKLGVAGCLAGQTSVLPDRCDLEPQHDTPFLACKCQAKQLKPCLAGDWEAHHELDSPSSKYYRAPAHHAPAVAEKRVPPFQGESPAHLSGCAALPACLVPGQLQGQPSHHSHSDRCILIPSVLTPCEPAWSQWPTPDGSPVQPFQPLVLIPSDLTPSAALHALSPQPLMHLPAHGCIVSVLPQVDSCAVGGPSVHPAKSAVSDARAESQGVVISESTGPNAMPSHAARVRSPWLLAVCTFAGFSCSHLLYS